MLLRLLTDAPANDAKLRATLRAGWGSDSCITWGHARHVDCGPSTHALSIRAAWGGAEYCHVDGRTLGVDDDNFLILNHGRIYSTSIRSLQPVESLAICFRSDLVERIHGAAAASIEQALWQGDSFDARSSEFLEHLQPHEVAISPVLRLIRERLARGIEDAGWYDEQLIELLAHMHSHQQHLLLRLFKLVHGVTPHTYLQRKRISVAVRLLESTQLTVREVSARVGFADDSTLVRQMRRWTKLTPGQVRARLFVLQELVQV